MNNLKAKIKSSGNVIIFPTATASLTPVARAGKVLNYAPEEMFTATVPNNDLIDFGIAENDMIIYHQTARWSDVRNLQICIVEIQGKRVLYAAIVGNNNEVFLCTNLGEKPEMFRLRSVKLLGIAIAFQRDLGGVR